VRSDEADHHEEEARTGSSGVPARPADRQIGRDELDRIIRRAAELQFHASEGPGEELLESEVLRIGEEVGLDPHHVRRAIEEARADAIAPALPGEASLLTRVMGPGRFQLRRVVPGRPEGVEDRLASRLQSAESLHPVRRRAGHSVWEPAEGILPQIQRGLKWKGHRYDLAEARRIQADVQELEDGFTLVSLTLDVTNLRAGHGTGTAGMSAGFGGGAGLLAATALSLPPLGMAALAGVGLAGGILGGVGWGRRAYRERAERVRLAAEGLLDRMERGEIRSLPRGRERRG
jgi:hypothetical protein